MHPKYFFFLFVILGGCICNPNNTYEYNTGKLPEIPVNMELVNSRFDDYNMALPIIHYELYLMFSSNRNSLGEDFDIEGGNYFFEWNKENGTFRIGEAFDEQWNQYITLRKHINGPGNEFGPLAYQISYYETPTDLPNDFLLYATDTVGGPFNIYLSYLYFDNGRPTDSIINIPLEGINSEYDELYPSFYGYDNNNFRYNSNEYTSEEMYLCNNSEGVFNIYKINIPENTAVPQFLMSEEKKTLEKLPLNSDANDKCPFIIGDILLFTSDREGGQGGFDIYYCLRIGNEWTEPKNLGPKINTEYNEYRPVSSVFWEYENDLVLFSSDRPGGLGGYDLYYAGTDKFRQE
jgi:hypothetical protein